MAERQRRNLFKKSVARWHYSVIICRAYDELYEDFEKYKVDNMQMLHKHRIYSVSK